MLWDKMSCFSFGQAVPATASTNTPSKVIDFKLNGGLDEHLRIFAMITGEPLSAASGDLVAELQHCDTVDGEYAKAAEGTLAGNKLIDLPIPRGHKRFMRLVYRVGETALSRAVTVWAGLLPETEITGALKRQNLNVTVDGVNTGLEDTGVTDPNLV